MGLSVVPPAAGEREQGGWRPPAHGGAPEQPAASRLVGLSVIGNRLRMPVARCEAGGCGARYDDPRALGEADIRGRAIADGWREDLTGLLICPGCQRRAPWPDAFRPAPPDAGRPARPALPEQAGPRGRHHPGP